MRIKLLYFAYNKYCHFHFEGQSICYPYLDSSGKHNTKLPHAMQAASLTGQLSSLKQTSKAFNKLSTYGRTTSESIWWGNITYKICKVTRKGGEEWDIPFKIYTLSWKITLMNMWKWFVCPIILKISSMEECQIYLEPFCRSKLTFDPNSAIQAHAASLTAWLSASVWDM